MAYRVVFRLDLMGPSFLIQNSGQIDDLILELERDVVQTQVVNNAARYIALADMWAVYFFEVTRMLRKHSSLYPFDMGALNDLHRRLNYVRSAFAKHQIPGRNQHAHIPSHSSLGGIVYAVYDEKGGEINVDRNDLVEDFLEIVCPHGPSDDWCQMDAVARGDRSAP